MFELLAVFEWLDPQAVSPNDRTAISPDSNRQSGLGTGCIFVPSRFVRVAAATPGERRDQLAAGSDAELPVDLGEV
jgi:hypothetical protein